MSEHAVIVYFGSGFNDLDTIYELEDKLEAAISEAGVGEYDGHEVALDGSDGSLYMYGPDADALFAVVAPILKGVRFLQGAKALKRYGPPEDDVRSETVIITGD